MAYPKSAYYRRITQPKGRRNSPSKHGPMGLSTNFHDPQLNAFWQYLVRQNQPQQNRGPRFNVPWNFEDLFGLENTSLGPGTGAGEERDGGGDSWYGSAFNWTIDKLSRPLYAMAEGSKDFSEQFTDVIRGGSLGNQISDIGDMFRAGGAGAWQGFSGNAHTTFADILRNPQSNPLSAAMGIAVKRGTGVQLPGTTDEWWRAHNKTTAAVGLTGDILLDPSTYVGLGVVGKLGTGARLFKEGDRVGAAVTALERNVDDVVRGGRMSHLQADKIKGILTSEKFRMGFQKQAGAKARTGEAISLIEKIAKDKAAFTKNRVMTDTLENLKQLNLKTVTSEGGSVTKTISGALRDRKGKFINLTKVAEEQATKAADNVEELTVSSMLDQFRTVVDADYKAALGLGTRKYRIPILPAKTTEGLAWIAQTKPIAIAAGKIQQGLRNSYKVVEDVYRVKTEAMHLARSTTYTIGRYIDETYKQISKENRVLSWVQGLRRDTTNGEIAVRAPGAAASEDAAVLFSRHVQALEERVRGQLGELPLTPDDLNRALAPGLPPFFKRQKKKDLGIELGLVNPRTGKVIKGKNAELQDAYENQDWVRYSLLDAATDKSIRGLKDGGHALWTATAAVEHAMARRQMMDNLAQAFGFSTRLERSEPIAARLLNDLKSKGWREVDGKGVQDLKGNLFNPEVATGIERMLKTMDDQREWGKFVKFVNSITGPFKFLVTQPNIGYHIRNLMGDAFINWIDRAVNPADYRAAARLLGWRFRGMKKFENVTETESPLLRIPGDPLENALHVTNRPLFKNTARLRNPRGDITEYITDAELYAGINKHGIRQNYAVSEFGELERELSPIAGSGFSDVTRKMGEPFRRVSEWREDYMRISHFIHLVRTNPTKARTLEDAMQYAGDRVRLTHFDYTDFTKFEQQVMSNIFPFYKWTRKALPLMSRFMFEHPGKVIIPEKINKNLSGAFGYWPGEDDPLPGLENGLVPFWLKEGGYKPGYDTPGTGNPMFLRMPSPFSDILGFQGNNFVGSSGTGFGGFADTLISQSTPYFRVPYELSANKQTMFAGQDVPITDKKMYLANQVPVPYMRPGISALGVGKGGEGNFGPLASSLTGFYSRELTERDQRNELYRQLFDGNLSKQEQSQVRRILRVRFGEDI